MHYLWRPLAGATGLGLGGRAKCQANCQQAVLHTCQCDYCRPSEYLEVFYPGLKAGAAKVRIGTITLGIGPDALLWSHPLT